MKITKAMGIAALLELMARHDDADFRYWFAGTKALDELNGDQFYAIYKEDLLTALAMCAAIAGVKPEDVE